MIQAITIAKHLEYMLTDRTILLHLAAVEIIGDLIPLDKGMSTKYQFQLLEHLICSVACKNIFEVLVLTRKHGALNY